VVPALLILTLYITLQPPAILFKSLNLVEMPSQAKYAIIYLAIFNFVLSYIFEQTIAPLLARLVKRITLWREGASVSTSIETGFNMRAIEAKKAARWRRQGKLYKALNTEMT
jgi:hypothetical protein